MNKELLLYRIYLCALIFFNHDSLTC